MNLHLEPREFYHTRLGDRLAPITAFDVRWVDSVVARKVASSIRAQDVPTLHIGSGETLITQALPNDELARGIVNRTLASSRLVAAMEPIAAMLRKQNLTRLGLIYGDFERVPNSDPASQPDTPGAFALLGQVLPGLSPQQIDARAREAVYIAACQGLLSLGLDISNFVMWAVADRDQGKPGLENLAVSCPVHRSHLIHTYPDAWCDERIERDLEGGSGPERVCCHLSTCVSPQQNAARLEKYRRYNVPDVVVFVDPTNYALSPEQRERVSVAQQEDYVGRMIDAQMPVFRDVVSPVIPAAA